MIQLKIKLLRGSSRMPTKAYATDSGFDCYVDLLHERVVLPGQVIAVPLGFSIESPPGHEVQIRPRSSALREHKLHVALGTIDAGYRGEVWAVVLNTRKEQIYIHPGARVCQMIVAPVPTVELVQVSELSRSPRGGAGFGSSGL